MDEIEYKLRVNRRARRMRVTIYCDGSCVVTVPRPLPASLIEKFLAEKSSWILDKVSRFKKFPSVPPSVNRADFARRKDQALALAENRVEYFNRIYGFTVNKISVKNQRTRWGSCSKKGNLNFNYKIALLPLSVADYIIVHELCHLGEFSHSRKFWDSVAKAIPDYLKIRRELRRSNPWYN